MDDLTHGYFVSHGDVPGELRVSDQNRFYVVHQVWEGRQILDTSIHSSYATEEEANKKCEELRE